MKQIPLVRIGDTLCLWGKINGSINLEFILDTGCATTLLSKEFADTLFLKGNLVESDIKGYISSSFGGVFTTDHQVVNIRQLSFGKVKIKNFSATVCDRYGSHNLIGMSVLDNLNNYSITKNMLVIDDGDSETITTTNKVKYRKPSKTRLKRYINKICKIREDSGLEDYKFDYSKHVLLIFYPIQSCGQLLLDKKFAFIAEFLEELQPLIKDNLEDDEKNIHQKGAFITAYFYLYLATAYYGLERFEEALVCYDKARIFFLDGSSILNEINEALRTIRKKLSENTNNNPKVFAPAKTTSFEEDIQTYNLQKIDFEDYFYGNGDIKSAYIGFQNFHAAYTFCRMNHKRLEILKMNNGKWQRTGNIPSDNLSYQNLEIKEGYKFYPYDTLIDEDLQKMKVQYIDDKTKIEEISQNAEKAKDLLKSERKENRFGSTLILCETNLAFDALIVSGANLSWNGQILALAAMDAEEFITKKLAKDVLAGRIIPCALGQMPEDFSYLSEKTYKLKPYCEEDYAANNDPENSRCMGPFILYDDFNSVGYGYRATYDDKIWRWEDVEHSNVGGFPQSGDDTSKENDSQICYWQLVIKRKENKNGMILPEAF